jgi:hypothetical protein
MLMAMALAGCHGGGINASHDMAEPSTAGPLVLTVTATPPSLGGLTLDSGRLELHGLSLFGDVAADARTMVASSKLDLPTGSFDNAFPDAPYGLYSRARFSIDDAHLQGLWKGAALSVTFEAEQLSIDARGPALDYGPTQGAHFVLTMDPTSWFDPVRLDAAAALGDIQIDALHNPDMLATLIGALQGSVMLAAAPAASN